MRKLIIEVNDIILLARLCDEIGLNILHCNMVDFHCLQAVTYCDEYTAADIYSKIEEYKVNLGENESIKVIEEHEEMGTYAYGDNFLVDVVLSRIGKYDVFVAYLNEKSCDMKKFLFARIADEEGLNKFLHLAEHVLDKGTAIEQYLAETGVLKAYRKKDN